MIKVIVNGAAGKMGSETVRAVSKEKDMKLVGACDTKNVGADAGGVKISKDLQALIKAEKPDVVVDFTHPNVAMENAKAILEAKVNAVIGTTGLSEADLKEIKALCSKNGVNCIVAPNFAVGAVLMMTFAKTAAKYMPNVEIIETHHDKKADAPSGTAIKTAELILEGSSIEKNKISEKETVIGARGGNMKNIHIHSVRLPGFVAHQEVIFGGLGQSLRIKHDTISRESFMPGVIMSIRKVKGAKGLVYGLENLL
ncbi:4-hydroxy-tetrahydrodipicolinate reductase [Candidatus Margulisiibacteriota bacterium]